MSSARRARLVAGLILADRGLAFGARWGVPLALGFLILSGPLLPLIGGGLTPYPGLRSLHVLAGLGLTLAAGYWVLAWGVRGARAAWLWARTRQGPRLPRRDPVRFGLAALHSVLLGTMLWTGIERYVGQRYGIAVAPGLSASEWGLAHRLLAPYYVAALLLDWSIKSRVAWRAFLDQLRRP